MGLFMAPKPDLYFWECAMKADGHCPCPPRRDGVKDSPLGRFPMALPGAGGRAGAGCVMAGCDACAHREETLQGSL